MPDEALGTDPLLLDLVADVLVVSVRRVTSREVRAAVALRSATALRAAAALAALAAVALALASAVALAAAARCCSTWGSRMTCGFGWATRCVAACWTVPA